MVRARETRRLDRKRVAIVRPCLEERVVVPERGCVGVDLQKERPGQLVGHIHGRIRRGLGRGELRDNHDRDDRPYPSREFHGMLYEASVQIVAGKLSGDEAARSVCTSPTPFTMYTVRGNGSGGCPLSVSLKTATPV